LLEKQGECLCSESAGAGMKLPREKRFIALGSRLLGVPEILTLGVKPNFLDYTPFERELIHESDMILFPTTNYAQFFTVFQHNGEKDFSEP